MRQRWAGDSEHICQSTKTNANEKLDYDCKWKREPIHLMCIFSLEIHTQSLCRVTAFCWKTYASIEQCEDKEKQRENSVRNVPRETDSHGDEFIRILSVCVILFEQVRLLFGLSIIFHVFFWNQIKSTTNKYNAYQLFGNVSLADEFRS